jgi:hypothetical protein
MSLNVIWARFYIVHSTVRISSLYSMGIKANAIIFNVQTENSILDFNLESNTVLSTALSAQQIRLDQVTPHSFRFV